MGKSTDQIYMDYQVMRQKAARLEELSGEIKFIAENEVACYGMNKNFWKGDSGDACCQKITKLNHNLERRARELQETARVLRSTAEKQYRLEMALAALVSR